MKNVSPALKEIAGRVKKLTYRDMTTLAEALYEELPAEVSEINHVITAILTVADEVETSL